MKAMVIEAHGGAEAFVARDLPMPTPGSGEVRIRVAATSVNPIDVKLRKAKLPFSRPLPDVLHVDVAGVVDAIGPGVSTFKVGDEVYGAAGGIVGVPGGALAEYMVADARLIAKKPRSLSLADAATLPLVAITAWEALVDRLDVSPGQKVLIHGGFGGVGHIAVQLAKALGAQVFTTVSKSDQSVFGADVVINYKTESVADYVKRHTDAVGFDRVFDTVGGENVQRSVEATRIGGALASIATGGTHDLTQLYLKGLSLHSVLMLIPMFTGEGREAHGRILQKIAELVDEGKMRPLIDSRRFSLETVGKAHALLESGDAVGKISVVIP